ncbi:hypothetical protein [Niabella hibiscisoli]|uniref:hypothetical protein n=1 Tax=Niabella hibiscisoli TaxID=1825928 RepID=UPI001F112822|nr:hypothetical protein [Niabella hibiscisoli]MCH5719120.1 hypothetical protein [Niabella hibiscisoli]
MAHAELNVNMLMCLYEYVGERTDQRRSNPSNIVLQTKLPVDFYNFIKKIDFQDNSMFISKQFSSLINQIEFGQLYIGTIQWMNAFRGRFWKKCRELTK